MKNSTVVVVCAGCLSLAAAMVAYDIWAKHDVRAKLTNVDVRYVWIVKLNCSPEHFWGHEIRYRDDDTGLPGDIYLHVGYACRDWSRADWRLVRDSDWQPKS